MFAARLGCLDIMDEGLHTYASMDILKEVGRGGEMDVMYVYDVYVRACVCVHRNITSLY